MKRPPKGNQTLSLTVWFTVVLLALASTSFCTVARKTSLDAPLSKPEENDHASRSFPHQAQSRAQNSAEKLKLTSRLGDFKKTFRDHPYLVYLTSPRYACFGTIISEQAILTSASCLRLFNDAAYTVWQADFDPETADLDFIPHEVQNITRHPHYAEPFTNDIAVIFTKSVMEGPVVDINEDPELDRPGYLTSTFWNDVDFDSQPTFVATRDFNILDNEQCQGFIEELGPQYYYSYYGDVDSFPKGLLCLYHFDSDSPCPLESLPCMIGSPAILSNGSTQIGIISANPFHLCQAPVRITRLSSFKCWLDDLGIPGITSTRGPCPATEVAPDFEIPAGFVGPERDSIPPPDLEAYGYYGPYDNYDEALPTQTEGATSTLAPGEDDYYDNYDEALPTQTEEATSSDYYSDSDLDNEISGFGTNQTCFPASARVNLESGQSVLMADLQLGDHVETGSNRYEPVIYFSHRLESGLHSFIEIQLDNGRALRLSPGHLLPTRTGDLIAARDVRVGITELLYSGGSGNVARLVSRTSLVTDRGLYNPHTPSHSIVVDGVVASCLTDAIPQWAAKALLLPERIAASWGLTVYGSMLDGNGMVGDALRGISLAIQPSLRKLFNN